MPIAGNTGELSNVAISLLKAWRSEVFSLKCTTLKFVERSLKENTLTSDSQARLPLDNKRFVKEVKLDREDTSPSTTSPVKIENWDETAFSIDSIKLVGVSHRRLPRGLAGTTIDPV